ncbi:MAG: 2-phospho-L-lactate transferase [Acidimicrobiia bacterium]|nr:2-phospho-L-lactate transferase [Acidimicrobiia bacterium]
MRRNDLHISMLGGGVGGARMARALASAIAPENLSVIVNIGDDESIYGLAVSPDLDSVMYTLAGVEGSAGWGRKDDTFVAMESLAGLGVDTTFRLGDLDLGLNLMRTQRLAVGEPLSSITEHIARSFEIGSTILPASDDRVPTRVQTAELGELSFQEYFVLNGAMPTVTGLRFEQAADAKPAPGVIDAIDRAEVVVIAPSNPPLSIWPMLAIPPIREAIAAAETVVAISPFVGGKPVKGPTDRVMASLGYDPSHAGVVAGYDGLLSHLVVDRDPPDVGVNCIVHDTMMNTPELAASFGAWFGDLWT